MRGVMGIVVIGMVWFAAGAFAADQVYVQSKRAKLLEAPDFRAATVLVAEKGVALAVLEEGPRWMRVRLDDSEGWVPLLVVGEKPPLEKVSVLDQGAEEVNQATRRRAASASSAGATRGLMEDTRRRSTAATDADFDALARMESLEIPESEVEAFLDYLKKP